MTILSKLSNNISDNVMVRLNQAGPSSTKTAQQNHLDSLNNQMRVGNNCWYFKTKILKLLCT